MEPRTIETYENDIKNEVEVPCKDDINGNDKDDDDTLGDTLEHIRESDEYEELLERIQEEPDCILSNEILDRLFYTIPEQNRYGSESSLYYKITRFAASLSFTVYNTETKRKIIENAVQLRERKYFELEDEILSEEEYMIKYPEGKEMPGIIRFTLRDFVYPSNFPLEINEVLLYFYRWVYDEKNSDKLKSLLKILWKYLAENLISVPEHFDEYNLDEMKEKLLNGEDITEYLHKNAKGDLTNFRDYEILSEEGMLIYRYPYLFTDQFEPWGSRENAYENILNGSDNIDILDTFAKINKDVLRLLNIYNQNIKQYECLIDDKERHIYQQDCPVMSYDGDEEFEKLGYGTMLVQRDVCIFYSHNKGIKWEDNILKEARSRLEAFLEYRKNKLYHIYINSISGSFRKCLFALRMCKDLMEVLLSNEHPEILANLEQAEEIYEVLDENCQQIERAVYKRYGTDVKATLKSIGYDGFKTLEELESSVNNAVKEYQEELRKVWEKETIIELQNNKTKRLTELRMRIPSLSKEVMEDTIKLYLTFLHEKSTDEELLTFINKKYCRIWETAERKLSRIYKEMGRNRTSSSMKEFIMPMFTAEYLYQRFVNNSMTSLLDYSSIALEYYSSMEYFMNAFIYKPLKELYLVGRETENYQEFMNQKTHDKIVRYNGRKCSYNDECMYGNFGFLLDNIKAAPMLLGYFVSFRNKGDGENETELIENIELLADKLVNYGDSIAKRRNESAHGGKVLEVSKAKAARAIVYDTYTDAPDLAVKLKDSFEFLLSILDIK